MGSISSLFIQCVPSLYFPFSVPHCSLFVQHALLNSKTRWWSSDLRTSVLSCRPLWYSSSQPSLSVYLTAGIEEPTLGQFLLPNHHLWHWSITFNLCALPPTTVNPALWFISAGWQWWQSEYILDLSPQEADKQPSQMSWNSFKLQGCSWVLPKMWLSSQIRKKWSLINCLRQRPDQGRHSQILQLSRP